MPVIEHGFKHIVFLCDWDAVIADQKNEYLQYFDAFCTVPLKKSMPIICKRHKALMKTLRDSRHEGQALKGLALNLDTMIEQEPSLTSYRAALMDKLNKEKPRQDIITTLK